MTGAMPASTAPERPVRRLAPGAMPDGDATERRQFPARNESTTPAATIFSKLY